MFSYLVRRLLSAIPVMVIVALVVFLLLHAAPGDPALIIGGDAATADDVARIRVQLGLDQPLWVQFARWMAHLSIGDLGQSVSSGLPVTLLIEQRIEPTLSLALFTIGIAILVAVPLGVAAACNIGRWIDRAVMGVAVLSFSVPTFLIGYLLIEVFARRTGWLPVQGFSPLSDGIRPFLSHLILPSITLGLVYAALLARMTRAAMLDVLGENFVKTARAKGLAPGLVVFRHGLRNASIPIVTTIGSGFALLIGGVVVTESVFGVPGLGRLTVDALAARDYPIIQGLVLVFALAYVVVNLLVDLSYALLDPRIRN